MTERRREQGVVLVLVTIFVLLLVSSIATFQRRAVLDATIASNRDATARAEALARGGVRLATALLLEDALRERTSQTSLETRFDVWSRARELELPIAEDSALRLEIDDAGARLNLNALFDDGEPRDEAAELLLEALLSRALEQAGVPADEEGRDPRALARWLIDYVDEDQVGSNGEFEDDWYQQQKPPYRAANRPLLSVDELSLVRGFDPRVVEALRPYVSVYPYVDAEGINPNTAPPWVLGALFHGVAGDYRFASVEEVERLVRARDEGSVVCREQDDHPACTAVLEELMAGETFPPTAVTSNVFTVRAQAQVKDVRRTIEAVIDRSDAQAPLVLSWRVW